MTDFQSVKARTSTRTTKSAVVLYFLLTSLLQNRMLTLIIGIQLERKRENPEPLWTVWPLFWPRFADHCFKFSKVPGYMGRYFK